jgi:dolichyl-phosphooligosaccharide-protein glycotransferase
MNKYFKAGIFVLAVLALNIYFRSYPIFFPQFKEQAKSSVDLQIRRNIALDVSKKFPGFQELAKAKLFQAAVAGYEKENKADINKRVDNEFAKLKDRFQNKNGRTYLMELDCWHWGRYVSNIERFGGIGDEVRNGKQYDNHMMFPEGMWINGNPFFYFFSWYLYKIFSVFYHMNLIDFLFYLPLFFMAVFTVLLYFFCWRNWGNFVAMVCCVFVGCAPIFLPRSCAGWFDTDILNLFYPVLIIWTYLLAHNALSWGKRVFWAVFSSFGLGIFCANWVGWPFILFIIIFYEILILANSISEQIQYKENKSSVIKSHLVVAAIFLFSASLWIMLFSGVLPFEILKGQIKDAMLLNKPLTSSIWPNVYSTVGELKKGDFVSIGRAVGGSFVLSLALLSMLVIFLNLKKYSGIKRDLLIILVVWFMVMFFLCSKGIRFTMFLLVPIGVFLGWGLDELYRFIIDRKWKLLLIPFSLAVVALTFGLMSSADDNARDILPLMDDNWYSVLKTVEKYTPDNSVLNSWWDFGDWFKTVSNRRVIFDGQSQNIPQAYWMARVFLTDSEKEAIGILRMLNNGGNSAFDIINKELSDPFLSVSLIKRAIVLEPEEGKKLLLSYIPPKAAGEVGKILYLPPKQKGYFIVDSSMIGKIVPISYLGSWDFIKVYLSRTIHHVPREKVLRELVNFGLDKERAEKYYQEATLVGPGDFDNWVSNKMSIPGIAVQKKTKDDIVLFNNGFIYNPNKKTIYSYSSYDQRYKIPKSLFLANGSNITEEVFPQNDSQYSTLLVDNPDTYKLVVLSPDLAKSMFARLMFLHGRGLEYFIPFTREGPDEDQVMVFEIKWQ